ncbi:nuclear polyadenylated RNA-binding protein 3-like isoform X2 [Vicia villosa]|uniref:nuclear polyadenylated RNA-binding protein 3-like isoform X2 n=1 Tax=Vicia villosa TaxID=3911 RepID=UPI00273BBBA1|nr:nuclear polyadenylated RNA-binding protein 3-like isoform X2 [Vicia villosa]
MGCFLQCFGLSTKRKRRKTLYKVLARESQKYGNYEVLAITEKAIIPYSESRDQEKEKSGVKAKKKKKVSFNLNLQIYEANPSSYQVLENEEEDNKEAAVESEGRVLGDGSEAVVIRYPSNHRYHNCGYDQDEEDEMVYEESDIDDEFDEEYDWDDDDDDDDEGYESCENYGDDEVCDENGMENQKALSSNDAEVKSNSSGRERSMNMNSVLLPVENLTQWKAIKAKVISNKNRRKENAPSEENTSMLPLVSPCILESNDLQSKPLLKEIAVDASLSNWLVSPNYNVSSTIRCQ